MVAIKGQVKLASTQDEQNVAIAANTALLQDAVNASQAELDAALAAGHTREHD